MTYEEFLNMLKDLGSAITATFGNFCEVAISDVDNPENAILYIFNGHVTGREVGDPLVGADLERVAMSADGYYINYQKKGKRGVLKSSTITFDAFGHKIAFCINCDTTYFRLIENFVSGFLEVGVLAEEPKEELSMEESISSAIKATGKPVNLLNKADRLEVIKTLDKQGMLKMQKSIATIAKMLCVSRYTVYNYLNELGIK